jgi:hypothetical protein
LNNNPFVRDVIRLCGMDPNYLHHEAVEAYEVMVLSACSRPEPPDEKALRALQEVLHPEFHAVHGGLCTFDRTLAQTTLLAFMDAKIAELEALDATFAALDERSRAEASLRALAPADTARNRLLLRYQTASASQLNRAVKTLEAMKAARKKEETEAAKAEERSKTPSPNGPPESPGAGLRNELDGAGLPTQHVNQTTSYVRIENRIYGFDRGYGCEWSLNERDLVHPDAVITDVVPFVLSPQAAL